MGTCINHPDRETNLLCMKHQVYMCEECQACRDPNIYCKFRSSCPIWFVEKRQKQWDLEAQAEAAAKTVAVTFQPSGGTVSVPAGTSLLDAARQADVYVNASCNGKGVCGKCRLVVASGKVKAAATPLLSESEAGRGYVLACQATVTEAVTARIPEEAIERKLKIAGMGEEATDRLRGLIAEIDPMRKEIALELEPPTLEDSVSDLDRLIRGLKRQGTDITQLNVGLPVMRQLADVIRREDWKITVSVLQRKCANEILSIAPGNGKGQALGLAIDIGTTTIVVYLVDVKDGTIIAAASDHNRQAACGDDVINRIVCAEKNGVKKLSVMALSTINSLIGEALDSVGADAQAIGNIVLSGNTTMVHLLLKIEPRYIRREPYIPSITEFPILRAGEIGLKADPAAAVYVMPGPAGYVGGDIVSGVMASGLSREEPLTMFVDVGTNGEIVLGNRDWMLTAACSAGPAFEGGGIRWGMRAEEGAIERVSIDPDTLEPSLTVIAEGKPRGICGSGMIDLISELLTSGIVDRSGRFRLDRPHPRIRTETDDPAYVLAVADESAMGEEIVFSQSDLKNLLYSKAAVYSGFSTLLEQAGLEFSMIDRMIITGGFGQYLNMEKAIEIGLLPDIERSKFSYLGNSSVAGAYMALLSGEARREAASICRNMTYVDFSSNPRYMDEFTSALFLPHTDLEQFPGVVGSR